jgi:hypothetical protein
MKQVNRVNQARRLASSPLFRRQDILGGNQIALAVAEDSEANQRESGNQALSPSSSPPPSQ